MNWRLRETPLQGSRSGVQSPEPQSRPVAQTTGPLPHVHFSNVLGTIFQILGYRPLAVGASQDLLSKGLDQGLYPGRRGHSQVV